MKKKIVILFLLLVIISGAFSNGQTDENKFVVGYADLASSDEFCGYRLNALKDLADSNPNIEFKYMDANADQPTQLSQIDNFIVQKVDVIVIVPVDYEGVVPGVEAANEAGVPVITLGIQSAGGKSTFVGSTNIDAGRMQGIFMRDVLPQGAKVLYLEGISGLYHSVERKQGLQEELFDKRADIELLSSLPGDYDKSKGMQITEDWIQSFPEFDAIIAANDMMALGAMEALKVSNRLDGVLISGVDGLVSACEAIQKGEMAQSIFQNAPAQGAKAYEVIELLMQGNTPSGDALVPFESIDAKNVKDYM